MKKFSTRLFSLLAVFCLVFFSFPLVSFASTKFRFDFVKDGQNSYNTVTSNVDALGIIQKSGSSFSVDFYFKTKPSSFSVKDADGWEYGNQNGVDFDSSLGYYHDGIYTVGYSYISSSGFKYVGPKMSRSELKAYLDANIGSPDPITPSLDSGLGSFVLGSNNAWANRVYGNNEYHGSFMTILRDTTTTGKKWGTDFDTLQYYTGVDHFTKLRVIGNNEDLGSFMSDSISVASDSQLTNGRGGHHFTVNCPEDFRQPMSSGLQAAGEGNLTFEQIYNQIASLFTQLINNNSYSFKPVVVVRPYNSKTGAYGNWLRVTSGTISKSTLNSSQNGSSLIGSSSEDSKDPTIKEPTGSLENHGVVSSGDTLDNAINNAYSIAPITNVDPSIVNNNYPDFYNQPEFQNSPTFSNNPNIVVTQSGIQSQSGVVSGGNNSVVINNDNNVSNNLENINQAIQGDSSGNDVKGSVLSNIFGLLGMITAVPRMLSVLFGWLPSWALTCAGVAFALILPLIIYKIIRG